jgi:threonine synthase
MPLWRGVIEEYREHLPVTDATPVITLLEGGTPLVAADNLSARTGLDIYLKYEGANPTGSFKDRGMCVAIAKAVEEGAAAVTCGSTGNTSASAAAYAAKAGLRCIVLVPRGGIALGKLAQALVHGAEVLEVEANFDAALEVSRALAAAHPVTNVNSVNPNRIEGQKTCAFEIVDSLGRVPDYQVMPVGNAGNITAQWKGYCEYGPDRPVMFGVQAEGAAPLVYGEPVEDPITLASAIRIGNPASW